MKAKKIFHVVGSKCPPETNDKFNEWYDEVHIPYLLKKKQLKKVTRFKVKGAVRTDTYETEGIMRSTQEYPQYLTIYEFDSIGDFEEYDSSPELDEGRADVVRIAKETGAEIEWRVQYEVMRAW